MGADFTSFSDLNYIDLSIPQFNLRGGIYDLSFQISMNSTRQEDFVDVVEKAIDIDVLPGDCWKSGKLNRNGNYLILKGQFE
jgi:lipopolysaccharide transport system ATP-binding protein